MPLFLSKMPGSSAVLKQLTFYYANSLGRIGGFGDRAYIGWIPVEEWKNVTRKEWEDIRLPGEKKGWKEWAVETLGQWEL